MARITELATELQFLILAIGDGQLTCRDIASVARTCKVLCDVATPLLYSHNISHDRSSVLIWAARNNRLDTVEKALAFGADIDTLGPSYAFQQSYGTPLHWATSRGSDDIVRLLLDHNARLDTPSRFMCSCWVNCSHSNYYSWNPLPQWFPLHLAICMKHETTAHIILDRRPPMHMKDEPADSSGSAPTILHCAAAKGLDTVVQRALNLYPGILDTWKHEASGRSSSDTDIIASPLHYTADCWDSKSVIRTLVSAGCDLEAEDKESMTPIWKACQYGNFATAMHLLAVGSQTRRAPTLTSEPSPSELSRVQLGHIPLLHLAVLGRAHFKGYGGLEDDRCHDEQVAFVKALIEEHGHTVHEPFPGFSGQMPLNTALRPNRSKHADALPALIRLLLEKGADPNIGDDELSPLFRVVQHLLSYDPSDSCDHEPEEDENEDSGHEDRTLEFPESPFWKANDEEIFKDATQAVIGEHMHTQCGLSFNPWRDKASEANSTRIGLRLPIDEKSDAWEVMTELLKFGAHLDTGVEFHPSPVFLAMSRATEEPAREYSYALLKFLLENHPSGSLSTRCLNKLLQECVTMSPLCTGREIVKSLLIKHGASLDYQDPTVKGELQNAFMESDDVWLAMLCFEKSCLLDPPDQLFLDALGMKSRRVARYILSKSDKSILTAVHRHGGDTPLHIAAAIPDFELSLLLIERGANVEALKFCSVSPLHHAIRCCHDHLQGPALRVARLLLDNGADPFRIHYEDDLDPTQCICDANPTLFNTPFSYAVSLGRIQIVSYMLQKHQLTSQHPCIICGCILRVCTRPLRLGAPSSCVIDALLEAGASPNGCGLCAHSFVTCYVKGLRAILQTEFTYVSNTFSLLPLQSLIAGGADVNQPNPDGETAATVMAEILSYGSTGEVDLDRLEFVQEVGKFFSVRFDDAGKASIICRLRAD